MSKDILLLRASEAKIDESGNLLEDPSWTPTLVGFDDLSPDQKDFYNRGMKAAAMQAAFESSSKPRIPISERVAACVAWFKRQGRQQEESAAGTVRV